MLYVFFFLAITPRPDERVFNTNKTFSGENKEREKKRVVYKYIICKRTPRLLEIISTVIKKKKKKKIRKCFYSLLSSIPLCRLLTEKNYTRAYIISSSPSADTCVYYYVILYVRRDDFLNVSFLFQQRFPKFSTLRTTFGTNHTPQ